MTRMVALLRAVNVSGRKLPMADLRATCRDLGWSEVATYIQSGNVIFAASAAPDTLETALEEAIERRFGLKVPVVVRTACQWSSYSSQVPFAEVARDTPSRLLMLLAKSPPATEALKALQGRATADEQIERVGDIIWIHYAVGVGRSKLTPSMIDRAIGSPTTGRNFTTVRKLQEMLD